MSGYKPLYLITLLLALAVLLASCGSAEKKVEVPVIDLDLPASASSASVATSDTSSGSSASADSTASSGESGSAAAEKGVTVEKLNMRDAPDGNVIDVVPKGTEVELIDVNGNWYKISYNGTEGYVNSAYVDTTGATESIHAEGEITAQTLNVRDIPASDGASLGKLNKGDTVTITGKSGDWYLIDYNGSEAYVSSEYVELK